MKVLKFGGTSVGSAERIRELANILKTTTTSGVVVVVSAMSGVTDSLIQLVKLAEKGSPELESGLENLLVKHQEVVSTLLPSGPTSTVSSLVKELKDALQGIALLKESTARSRDLVISFGELLSATIIAEVLSSLGVKAEFVDSRDLIVTDSRYSNARVDFALSYKKIAERLKKSAILPVLPGFIARSAEGQVTTLGRGGSDYTASIIGAALKAEEIQIWTDVDGILSADPRIVKEAVIIPEVSYEEAMELSHFGAKVIYPPTILPAYREGIPIRIKNSFNPQSPGSIIKNSITRRELPVTGVSSVEKTSLVLVQGGGMQGVSGTAKRVF